MDIRKIKKLIELLEAALSRDWEREQVVREALDRIAAEREERRRIIRRRIRVGDRTTEGATIPDLRIPDSHGEVGERRNRRSHGLRRGDLGVRRAGTDDEGAVALLDPGQLGDPRDRDESVRRGHAQLEEGDETLATGEELPVGRFT